ncbi:AEC family transporter [Vallitalea okinawensis]|uniref:AEC family transporter n=1 Tax=Vallitalea okinawensis TaxID=2078660 RepID=UPI000CFD859E|nr:AEC family transporter [Vallitalea okinawensis]
MDFILVINQIIILFLLLILGYVIHRLKIIDANFIKKLSGFLLKVTLPALIISSMQLRDFNSELLEETLLLTGISIVTYLIAIVLAMIIPRLLPIKQNELGLYQFILVFANVGFIGYPLVEAVLGKEAIFYAAIFNLPFNFLVYTLGYYYMTKNNEHVEKFNLKKCFNPGVIAVFIGFALFVLPIKLPYAINEAISIVGGLTTPLSMIIVGGLLIDIKLKDLFKDYMIYFVSFYRMIVFPLLIFGLMRLFFGDSLNIYLMGVPIIVSALPVAVNAAILAERYDQHPDLASKSIFISTLLSMITIPLIAYIVF